MRPFRFGVVLVQLGEAKEWAETCRLAETLDYDTIHVPDRLGLPALVRVADITERPRAGTLVLDAGRHDPAQLARETGVVSTLTEIIGQLRARRERFGISYVSVLGTRMVAMAPVVEALSWT